MAVVEVKRSSTVTLSQVKGKSQTLGQVTTGATDEKIFEAATIIGGLLKDQVDGVVLTETILLEV